MQLSSYCGSEVLLCELLLVVTPTWYMGMITLLYTKQHILQQYLGKAYYNITATCMYNIIIHLVSRRTGASNQNVDKISFYQDQSCLKKFYQRFIYL